MRMMFANFALILLLNSNNEVLLLRRINTPFCNGCYSLPGGEIKRGETARETIVREARDSLRIVVKAQDLEFSHVMYRKCNEPEFFAVVFKPLDWYNLERSWYDNERYDDLRWFSLDQLPDNMVPAHRHAIEQIQKNIPYSEHGW